MIFASLWNSKECHALCHVFFRCWNAAGVSRAQSWCQHATEGPGWLGNAAVMLFLELLCVFLCFLNKLCVLDLILVEFHFDSSDHFHVTCCLQGALGYYDSQTLLMAAAKSRQDTFSRLWIHGSDAFCEFQVPCLPVCLFGMFSASPVQGPEVFKTLIELRADVNARSNNGMNCASFGNWMWGVWSCNLANEQSPPIRFLEAEQFEQKCKQKIQTHLRFLARNPEQVRVLINAKADLHSHCEPLGADLGVKHVWSETTYNSESFNANISWLSQVYQ